MANKFTKSVLERQAKDFKRETGAARAAASAPPDESTAHNPQAVTPAPRSPLQEATSAKTAASDATAGSGTTGNTSTDAADTQQIETPAQTTLPEPLVSAAPTNSRTSEPPPTTAGKRRSAPLDLDAYLVRDGGRSAKNKTFYLDDAVIDGLHSAATARGIPDSKLVNDILRKVLGV